MAYSQRDVLKVATLIEHHKNEGDAALAILDALTAAGWGPAGEGWLPIETAPRAGSEFEIAEIRRARWLAFIPGLRGPMWETEESLVSDDDDCGFTHWRPLSASPANAPTVKTGQEDEG